MSALAQRQWRQRAQTAVRVAITATKEARTTYQGLSDGGDGAMSDLSNALLQLSHLPGLALPQPLAAMCPDVRAAAAAKLARQQAALAEALAVSAGGGARWWVYCLCCLPGLAGLVRLLLVWWLLKLLCCCCCHCTGPRVPDGGVCGGLGARGGGA